MTNITLRYFDGCPNWKVALERIHLAVEQVELRNVRIELERVASPAEAEAVGFPGSPTVLIDGRDPFIGTGAPVGLSCRMFVTEDGSEGAPSVSALVDALRES